MAVARRRVLAVSILVSLNVIVTGCRGPEPEYAPSSDAKLVDLKGTLKLIDGTPVPGAKLVATCGRIVRTTRTDQDGRFNANRVPEGTCTITSLEARLDERVRVGSNVLRGSTNTEIQLTVPPVRQVLLEVTTAGGKKKTVYLDETLHHEHPYFSDPNNTGFKGKVDVKSVKAQAWMPLRYRGLPRGNEIFRVPLASLDLSRFARLKPVKRQLIVLQRCGVPLTPVLDLLENVVRAYGTTGVRASVIVTQYGKECEGEGRLLVPVLIGSEEVLWALQARAGDLVLLNQNGRVLLRRPAIKGSALQAGVVEDVVAFLEKTWPIFAAVRRVSLNQASSVKAAETERLVSQATEHLKAKRYVAARRMLDRVLEVSPDLAEAHKQQALIKARLGDYTGAMQEVSWWRTSFGSEAADDLLDKVQQACKGSM